MDGAPLREGGAPSTAKDCHANFVAFCRGCAVGAPVFEQRPVDCFSLLRGKRYHFVCVDDVVKRLWAFGDGEGLTILCEVDREVVDDPHEVVDSPHWVIFKGV